VRIPLKALIAIGPAHKVGQTWVVEVARRDGVFCGPRPVVTFRTKREAVEFAKEVRR
jgi:hypothetical protein